MGRRLRAALAIIAAVTTPPGEDCRILRDTFAPGEQRTVAPEAARNFDLVANTPWH